MKKRPYFAIIAAAALLLGGCGVDEPAEVIQDDFTPPVTSAAEPATAAESVTEPEVPDTQGNAPELVVNSNTNDVSFTLANTTNIIERCNMYSRELTDSYRLDSIIMDVEYDSYSNKYTITFTPKGEKLYDVFGDDVERGLSLTFRLLDSDKAVIESATTLFDGDAIKVHDRLEDKGYKAEISFLDLEKGDYIIEFDNRDESNFAEMVKDGTPGFDPDRSYTIFNYTAPSEGCEPAFDPENDTWIYELTLPELYIDDDLILHGLTEKPLDLKKADGHDSSEPSIVFKEYYPAQEFYDYNDPASILGGVLPSDQMPTSIRITVANGGNVVFGARPHFLVALIYNDPETNDRLGSIWLTSIPGKYLKASEWEEFCNCIEKAGVSPAELK